MTKKSLVKTTIIQSAAEIADSEGLDQVTLAALAKKLGIKSPSLYNHIEGMAGLRRELAIYGVEKLRETVFMASVGKSGEKAIYSIGLAYVNFVRRHPGLYEATMPVSSEYNERLQEVSDEIVNLLLLVLEEFNLERDEALHTVRGLRSLVHGFASLELKKGFGLDLSLEESLEEILKIFLAGLKARA